MGIDPWDTDHKETLYFNEGDRLKHASPEVRALIADPVRSAPFRMGVLYNTNSRSELKRAIARSPAWDKSDIIGTEFAWGKERTKKPLPAWKAISGESIEDKHLREGDELGYTDEWQARQDEWDDYVRGIDEAESREKALSNYPLEGEDSYLEDDLEDYAPGFDD
jgi:hypothetical protein